jgi:hypothetical protein
MVWEWMSIGARLPIRSHTGIPRVWFGGGLWGGGTISVRCPCLPLINRFFSLLVLSYSQSWLSMGNCTLLPYVRERNGSSMGHISVFVDGGACEWPGFLFLSSF